jgi:hypothetical protein
LIVKNSGYHPYAEYQHSRTSGSRSPPLYPSAIDVPLCYEAGIGFQNNIIIYLTDKLK